MAETESESTNVLLVVESLRPSGATRYATVLFRGLSDAGFTVFLAAPGREGLDRFSKEERKRIEVFPGMLGGFIRPFGFRRLVAWARERAPSVIHGLSAFTSQACQKLSKSLDRPHVLSVNHYQERGGLRVGDRCMKILASSESIRENLVNTVGVAKELVKIVALGIPLPELSPPATDKEDRHPLVVTLSSLTPRTNIETFLRAARKVLDVRCGACQFLIVGEGPEEPALRKLTRELKLEKHVTFSNPGVPLDQVLQDADVYVKVPKQQGFCMSVLEAMSFGLPVVASSVGGLIPLVSDGQTGFLVPVGDHDATAKRILDVLQDEHLREKLGKAARETVENSFAYPSMVDRTAMIYASVLGVGFFRGVTTLVRKASDPKEANANGRPGGQ